MGKIDRYFLDIRVGCAGVRDRQHPSYDEYNPGLHQDTPDVVLYKHGINPVGGTGWIVRDEDILELQELCDKLNVWPDSDKKINELLS